MSGSWSSYPSLFTVGHRLIKDIFATPLNVEEKIDGSQFSFGLVEPHIDSEGRVVDPIFCHTGNYIAMATGSGVKEWSLKVRSKGAIMHIDAPESLFKEACETVKRLAEEGLLHPGWTYRGECLKKPKHNSLVYDRVPRGHIILFDVSTGDQEFLNYEAKAAEAARLGLECVPLLYSGVVEGPQQLRDFFETTSILGGQKIEGVVLKPTDYSLFGPDKKVLMGKFVSEAFKEVHRKSWGESNPSNKDIIQRICEDYTTPARWNKALIHLREEGKVNGTVQDIGTIIREVPPDVLKECEDEIRDRLFNYAWPHVKRGLTRGLAEWYKDKLMREAFESEDNSHKTPLQDYSCDTELGNLQETRSV